MDRDLRSVYYRTTAPARSVLRTGKNWALLFYVIERSLLLARYEGGAVLLDKQKASDFPT